MKSTRPIGPPDLRIRHWVLLGTALAVLLEAFGPAQPLVSDVAGLWLVFGGPIAVWYGTATRVASSRDCAALVALGFALITDLLAMLALNELAPLMEDQRPLSKIPIMATAAVTVVVLGAFLPEARTSLFEPWRLTRMELVGIGGAGLLCLVLSVAGPVRLNNGYSSAVSIFAFVCVTGLLIVLLAGERLTLAAVECGLYCVSLSLLLLTSLRGWLITGHDIQKEYGYFSLAFSAEHWGARTFADAYNACLSITLLPVEVARLTAIPGAYFFKAGIPVLFATAPVMIFRAARSLAPHRIAVLSAAFFVMFPTYFTDMPYEGRQAIAFLLLGGAILLFTDRAPRLRDRRIAFVALMCGVAISHYSTTYVIVIVLGSALVAGWLWQLRSERRARRAPARSRAARRNRGQRPFLVWWTVLPVAGFALVWAGPVTNTAGQLTSTVTVALQQIAGTAMGSASSGASYSIFGAPNESDQQRLTQYRDDTLARSAVYRRQGGLLPMSLLAQYPTAYVPPETLPLTRAGIAMKAHGVNVGSANKLLRNLAADLLQGLIFLGLLATWLRRRKGSAVGVDQVTLAVGGLVMLALVTLIPQLSVDYSVLRAFQQAFFFFGPFMAIGLMWALGWLRRWTVPVVCTLTAALVLDLTGVVPRLTGDYPAQLSLSNSGQYYDIYEPTPAEQSAAAWLETRISKGPDPKDAVIQTDEFTYNRLRTVLAGNGTVSSNLYPTLLKKQGYTFIGAQTVEKNEATIFYKGDLVTYTYPTALLNRVYDEIYSGDGVEIFQ